CETKQPKLPTTTTKHPHLSVVQFFKELLPPGSEEARLCSTSHNLSSTHRNFFNRVARIIEQPKAPANRPPHPSSPAAASEETASALKEVRIIDTQTTSSTSIHNKEIYARIRKSEAGRGGVILEASVLADEG
ncbi:hypothetical protein, partial [Thauera sp. 63]|uniref:hypothetical protein n=1 Tax=Thauera sp. 63 TaxID=497321 RepID=UPI001E351609